MTLAYTKREYLGVSVAAAIGSLIFSTMPFVVGATIATFEDPSKGGIAAAAELAAMGAGSLMIGAWLGRTRCRTLAVLMAVLLAVGHGLSAWTISHGDWTMFLVSRAIVGLSEGALYGLANGTAARSDRADRTFIYIAFAQTICNALASIAITVASLDYAPARVFTTFALFAGAAVPIVALSPARKLLYGLSEMGFAASLLTPLTIRLLIGFAFYSIALNLLLPFVKDIGVANGISRSMIAVIITCSNFAALLGPPLISGVGLKFGRTAPIIAIAVRRQRFHQRICLRNRGRRGACRSRNLAHAAVRPTLLSAVAVRGWKPIAVPRLNSGGLGGPVSRWSRRAPVDRCQSVTGLQQEGAAVDRGRPSNGVMCKQAPDKKT